MIPQVYRDVDILESLGRIVNLHTKEFKEDFELDKKIILKLAQSTDETDRRLIWMCRPLGTHCLREGDVFLEDTYENRVLYAYHSEKPNKNLLYALHLKSMDGSTVKGDIYTLDYAKEVERLPLVSCPIEQVTIYYPDGNEFTVPFKSMRGAVNELSKVHGDPASFRYHPESEAELGMILRRIHCNRDRRANRGSIDLYLEDLRGGSLRGKLQKAKAEVQGPAQKTAKKNQQSL